MAYAAWSVSFGEQPSAAKWNILGTNDATFDALIGSGTAWTSYTPTWTSTGGSPSLGNGTLTGRYQQFGKTVVARISLVWGSTTSSAGASGWLFALPVNNSTNYSSIHYPIGSAYAENAAVLAYFGQARILSTQQNKCNVSMFGSATSYVDDGTLSATTPFTWATGDYLSTTITYEAA